MNRGALHPCPVPNCDGKRQRWQAVCEACWSRLPYNARQAILGARKQRARHLEASASIAAVTWLAAHTPAREICRVLGEAPP